MNLKLEQGGIVRLQFLAGALLLWAGGASAQAVDNLPTQAALAKQGGVFDPGHLTKAPVDWRLKGEYVGTGDLDADLGAPLAENKTNLSGGLDYARVVGPLKVTTSGDVSVADDYSKDNKNGSAYGLTLKLATAEPVSGWSPSIKAAWSHNLTGFFDAYDRDDVTYTLEAAKTFGLRKDCKWQTGQADPCLGLTLTPSLAETTSSDDATERGSAKLTLTLTGVTAFGVRIATEGVIERRAYRHDLTGADYKRNDDRREVYIGTKVNDLTKAILRDVNLSTLKDLWLGARYVRQESNSRNPKHSYDRLQLVFTVKFGGAVYYPDRQ